MSNVEKKISERCVYSGKIFRVYQGTVELPNGLTAGRDRIEHHGGAGMLVLDQEGYTYLVRQYRYGIDRELLEIPAGKLEQGEDPRETVVREMTEEIGLMPREVVELGPIELSPAYLGEITYLYFGKDPVPCKKALDEDEFLDVLRIPFSEAVEMVRNGTITDAKTQIAILKVAAML